MKTILKLTLVMSLLLFVGCGSSETTTDDFDKPKLEALVHTEYNQRLQQQGAGFTCNSVTLMAMDDKRFEGWAETSTGQRIPVTVTLGKDGVIWKANPLG